MSPQKTKRSTIGFFGTGQTAKRNIYALLDDFIEASGSAVSFILPVTMKHWTDQIDAIADYAKRNGIPVSIVADASTKSLNGKGLVDLDPSASYLVKDVSQKIVSLLAIAEHPTLFVLWDQDDPEVLSAARSAAANGVDALDLTNGLDQLHIEQKGATSIKKATTSELKGTNKKESEMTEDAPYTEKELKKMDAEELKEILTEWEIEIPSMRGRATPQVKLMKLVNAILEAQDAPEEEEEDIEEEEEDIEEEIDDEEEDDEDDEDDDDEEEDEEPTVDGKAVTKLLKDIAKLVDTLNKELKPIL